MLKKYIVIVLSSLLIFSCTISEIQIEKIDSDRSDKFELGLILLKNSSTNTYTICNEKKECIIIDPAFEAKNIAKTLQQKKYKLKAIFLTHNHWDHSKEINILSDLLSIPIITNMRQIEMGKTPLGTPLSSKNIVQVADRQVVKFAGINIEIFFSPGHSKGSMCFYHKKSGSLFSGDTIFNKSIGRTDLEGSEREKIIDSVYRVLNRVEKETDIYPGHGEKTTKIDELKMNPFLNVNAK